MDDVKFDELIRRAGAVPLVRSESVQQLAVASRPRGGPTRRRRLLVIGGAIGGTVLLAAATGTAALMGVPPFQSLEPGMYRTQASIAIDYRSVSGHENRCRAFLEFTHLTAEEADAADALVAQHDWSGLGQRAYDEAAQGSSDPDVIESRFTDELTTELHTTAMRALPGIAASAVGADGSAAWSGWSMSCEGGQQ